MIVMRYGAWSPVELERNYPWHLHARARPLTYFVTTFIDLARDEMVRSNRLKDCLAMFKTSHNQLFEHIQSNKSVAARQAANKENPLEKYIT